MQNNSFIKIHRISFVCCAHCLPGTSTQRGQAGTRIPWMCAIKWVKWWLSRSPPGPRKAKLHVQSSLVFSRFNLKHKQRPNPSKKTKKQKTKRHVHQASNENKNRKAPAKYNRITSKWNFFKRKYKVLWINKFLFHFLASRERNHQWFTHYKARMKKKKKKKPSALI